MPPQLQCPRDRDREQTGRRRPIHLMNPNGGRESAAALSSFWVRSLAHRDVELAVALLGRQQAVASGKGVRNADDTRGPALRPVRARLRGRSSLRADARRLHRRLELHLGGGGVTTWSLGEALRHGGRHRAEIVADEFVEARLAIGFTAIADRAHIRSAGHSSPAVGGTPQDGRRTNTIKFVRPPRRRANGTGCRSPAGRRGTGCAAASAIVVVRAGRDADDLAVVDGDRVLNLALVEDQILALVPTGPAIALTSTRGRA